VPNKAWPGIVFSHWGRLELNHTSNTDYGPDDYSKPFVSADMDTDWREAFEKHPCFDPKKVRTVLAHHQLKPARYLGRFSELAHSPPATVANSAVAWPCFGAGRPMASARACGTA
jgi:hypothetical protein